MFHLLLISTTLLSENADRSYSAIVTDRVNEIWGTDMRQTVTTDEGKAYVFAAVEHANSEVVGVRAAKSANRFEARWSRFGRGSNAASARSLQK
ncbi:hypothetical protein [Methylocystis echinoides]|uniref:hypothetical protein n=1 Tax=Methylocystis echinoides TaxID=29468 RepID=UPI00344A38B7